MQVGPETCLSARLAIYADGEAEPKVDEVQGTGPEEVIHKLCTALEAVIRQQRSDLPQPALRALVQNLIHARFQDATISVLDHGRTVRVADRGPGIADKELAVQPGFSTAGEAERRFIAGVGSGLAVVTRLAEERGGSLQIIDNLGGGTVATFALPAAVKSIRPRTAVAAPSSPVVAEQAAGWRSSGVTDTGKRLLLLLAELGGTSLSTICDELRLSADASRSEVAALRSLGLLDPRDQHQIRLTPAGLNQLEGIFVE